LASCLSFTRVPRQPWSWQRALPKGFSANNKILIDNDSYQDASSALLARIIRTFWTVGVVRCFKLTNYRQPWQPSSSLPCRHRRVPRAQTTQRRRVQLATPLRALTLPFGLPAAMDSATIVHAAISAGKLEV
jgi:hypothetical protein